MSDTAYALSAVDKSGRVADRSIVRVLGGMPGTRLDIREKAGTIVARPAADAAHSRADLEEVPDRPGPHDPGMSFIVISSCRASPVRRTGTGETERAARAGQLHHRTARA